MSRNSTLHSGRWAVSAKKMAAKSQQRRMAVFRWLLISATANFFFFLHDIVQISYHGMLVILSCCEKPTLHSSMTSIYWRDIYWGIGKPKKPVQQISRIIRYLQQLWAYSEQTRSDSSIILLRCMVIVLSQCICDTPRCLSTIAFLPTAPDRWPCGFYIHTSSDRIGQVSLCPKEASSHAVSKIWLKHHGKYLLSL